MKSLLKKILFGINLLLAVGLLIAYFAPFVKPTVFWPIAFFGLATPYLILGNFLFLLFWLFFKNKRLLISAAILIAGYNTIPNYLQFPGNNENIEEGIKVMSFNVRLFDLYQWSKEKTTRNEIFDFLQEEDPDILCLQEFYYSENHEKYEFKTLDTLVKIMKAKHYHVYYTITLRETDHWGIVTFSKYPIVNRGLVHFADGSDNVCIYSDVVKQNDTLRIYNAHLASIRLEKNDYKVMEEINNNDYSNNLDEEMQVLTKVKNGFKVRALQADSIHKSIQNSPYPSVFCGDFNDTPSSYAYHTVKGKLKDAFLESGSGLGKTYIGDFPSFRIDYILYDQHFKSAHYKTHDVELSDHHPISAVLDLKQSVESSK